MAALSGEGKVPAKFIGGEVGFGPLENVAPTLSASIWPTGS